MGSVMVIDAYVFLGQFLFALAELKSYHNGESNRNCNRKSNAYPHPYPYWRRSWRPGLFLHV